MSFLACRKSFVDLRAINGHFAGTPFIQPHLATFKVEEVVVVVVVVVEVVVAVVVVVVVGVVGVVVVVVVVGVGVVVVVVVELRAVWGSLRPVGGP